MQGTVQDIGAAPLVDCLAIVGEGDSGRREPALQLVRIARDVAHRDLAPDQQPRVQPAVGDRIQSAWCDWTISKPGAIQSMLSNSSGRPQPAGGSARRLNTTSGSSRGWQVLATESSPCPSQNDKVVSQTVPQIGAKTLYSGQMPRLVKPIL